MSQEVPARPTPFTADELLDALRAAWALELGGQPGATSLAVLAAQIALETANGARCICNNPGNFKAYAGHDWCVFRTTEYVGGQPRSMDQSFVAFATLADGICEYLRQMFSHWTKAWPSVIAGDPDAFAIGLHAQGYYTAPVAAYASGLTKWFAYYCSKLGGDHDITAPEVEPLYALPDVTPDAPNTPDDPQGAA